MFWLSKTILEPVDIQGIKPDPIQVKILPREVCEQVQAIIFAKERNNLAILTTNNFPDQVQALTKQLEQKNYLSELYYTSPEGFQEAMKWYDAILTEEANQQEENKNQAEAAGKGAIAVLQKVFAKRDTMDPGEFIMEMVRLAFQSGASDLHFQSEVAGVFMRIRVDGVLETVEQFTHEEFVKFLQKMKFISWVKMNIDYVPQDGRFSFEATDKKWEHRQVDARINFMPGVQNESTVIRFLDGGKGIATFEEIGFTGKNYETLKRNIEKNVGITIITGPTGSGKTTTLYSVLHTLNDGSRKIITLEDPIEYQVPGIQQSQINYAKWYDYELGLKAILRHDPEVILVWETRTAETAETSINAALTGHAVFTTLHTNSAIESISRLLNMGVKSYMLAPSLNMIVAQRLVRKVCPHCMTKRDPQYGEKTEIEETIKKINDSNPTMNVEWDWKYVQAVWCEVCNGTGYIGRIAIVEVLEITDDIRNMIIDQANTMMIYSKVRETGYLTMKEDGILKMLQWLTTLDELRRVA